MNLSKVLQINGDKYPDREALLFGEQRITYRQWNEQADHLARHLQQKGIQRGDRVVLMMPNLPDFAILYFAILRAGGVAVPINARFSREEVAYILEDCQAGGIFVHEKLFPSVAELAGMQPSRFHVKTGPAEGSWESLEDWKTSSPPGDPPRFDPTTLTGEDEVDVLYTSGTTGCPKGVRFSHSNLLTVGTMIAIEFEVNLGSRVLHMMPLSHSAPLHLMFVSAVIVGASHVFYPTFTPEIFLRLVEQERITHFFGAPVAYLLSMGEPAFREADLSSAKYWVYGGSPLSKDQADAIADAFGKEKLVCVYGLTEAGPSGTLMHHRDYHEKSGSIGRRGALFTEIEIVDEQGQPCPVDRIGEIRLRGEGTMLGYLNRPEETMETLKNGWIYTGDLAFRDGDGFFWIVDRKKDVIITGGVNVYPKEVEDALNSHPGVQEAAVVGLPHPTWGETVTAFMAPKPGANPLDEDGWLKEVRRYLAGKIAEFKIPGSVRILTGLPRNASGKILKHRLKEIGTEADSYV
ncbi:class I adenylate-forming enzyme family protein [Kroppenstedtia eburnea]|uniref:class I adenylate-forming enzyme family protein n=1 Tax=Kroppenstedtia eburnea TaxID=714067 RepID=UPI00362594F7